MIHFLLIFYNKSWKIIRYITRFQIYQTFQLFRLYAKIVCNRSYSLAHSNNHQQINNKFVWTTATTSNWIIYQLSHSLEMELSA